MKRLVLIVLVLAVAAGALYGWFIYAPVPPVPRSLTGDVSESTLVVGDRTRSFIAYVPRDLPANAPLLIVLHGSTQTGALMRQYTAYEFDELADARKLAVVYPDGYKHAWNDCRIVKSTPAKLENVDDVGFLKALIAHMHAAHATATTGVYLFGYSNGGQMAYRLAFDSPELVGAYATVGSNLPVADNMLCNRDGPTARAMIANGTADPLNPFNGGEATLFGFASRGFVISANDTATALARRNGLETAQPATLPHLNADDPTSVTSRTWSRDGAPYVVQYVVQNGGHVVPQQRFRYPRAFGKTTGDLDLPKAAVEFFVGAHP